MKSQTWPHLSRLILAQPRLQPQPQPLPLPQQRLSPVHPCLVAHHRPANPSIGLRAVSADSRVNKSLRDLADSHASYKQRHTSRLTAQRNFKPLKPLRYIQSLDHQELSTHHIHLQSSAFTLLIASAVFVGAFAVWAFTKQDTPVDPPDNLESFISAMATEVPPGRPGNLTPDQEEKLRLLWQNILQLCGVTAEVSTGTSTPKDKVEKEADTPKKKRFGVFRRKGNDKASPAETPKEGSEEDKYGQMKKFQEVLANQSPEEIRSTIWQMVKHDHPDALVLRFLRARKWDVDAALVMFVATMNWRHSDMKVDDDIMKNGELDALEASENATDASAKTLGHDFLEQARMGKSFLHGTDKNGRPICVVRVRLHKQGEQCEESLERYTVFIIETARMALAPPIDTATIVFDMTGFSMANMDYGPVKFMIKCFEANYPESLGAVLVHNAPWVFQGIWKIIRGWLDPVVAGKVHFTNHRSGLEEFIEPNQIIKELGGDEDWEFKYIEPVAGENDKMKDTAARDVLLKDKEEMVKDFEESTLMWVHDPQGEAGKEAKSKRESIAAKLKHNYWQLDPYVRARSLYDRQGVIQEGGKIDWYNTKPAATPVNGGPETSADDVD